MEKTGIRPGMRLELQLERKMEKEPNFVLLSTFETDVDEENLLVSAPFFKGNYFPLLKGDVVLVSYFTEMGRYHFETVYREPRRQGNLHFLLLRRTSEILRTQRRGDFRLSATLSGTMEFTEVDEDGVPSVKRQKIVTIDISGGGIAAHTNVPLAFGDEVSLRLPLELKGYEMNMRAHVCWVRKNPPDNAYRFCVGLRFLYDDPRLKERVIQHIFRLQQQRRKRQIDLD